MLESYNFTPLSEQLKGEAGNNTTPLAHSGRTSPACEGLPAAPPSARGPPRRRISGGAASPTHGLPAVRRLHNSSNNYWQAALGLLQQ